MWRVDNAAKSLSAFHIFRFAEIYKHFVAVDIRLFLNCFSLLHHVKCVLLISLYATIHCSFVAQCLLRLFDLWTVVLRSSVQCVVIADFVLFSPAFHAPFPTCHLFYSNIITTCSFALRVFVVMPLLVSLCLLCCVLCSHIGWINDESINLTFPLYVLPYWRLYQIHILHNLLHLSTFRRLMEMFSSSSL